MQKYTKKDKGTGLSTASMSYETSVSQKEENIYTKISFLEKILWRNGIFV